jgi:uncharacterized phage-associated protein
MSVAGAFIEHMFESSNEASRSRKRPAPPYHGGMSGSAHAVAAEIRRQLPSVGEVKLHKLLYYAQGHHLASFGEPLFGDTISAWDMGPVVGSLWHAERYGIDVPDDGPLDEGALNTIGYILSRYGGMTGRDLIRLSHGETPWLRADMHRRPGGSIKIANESIRDYFATTDGDDDDEPLDEELLAKVLFDGAEFRRDEPGTIDSIEELRRLRASLAG